MLRLNYSVNAARALAFCSIICFLANRIVLADGIDLLRALKTGPYYMIDDFYSDGKQTKLRLLKLKMWANSDQRAEEENYLADVSFEPAKGKDAPDAIRLGKTVRLLKDSDTIYSRLQPSWGTPITAQIQWRPNVKTDVYLCDAQKKTNQKIGTFSSKFSDPDAGVCALNHHGSGVLIVTPKEATLWDPTNSTIIDKQPGLLPEICRLIATKRGEPGRWWLSDDNRSVVIAPPRDIVTRSGSGGGPPTMPVTIAGIAADLNVQGLVYDRTSKSLSVFPTIVQFGAVYDIAARAGQFELLYTITNGWSGTVRGTDLSGRILAEHSIPEKDRWVKFAGWDSIHSTFWYEIRQSRTNLPSDDSDADTVIIAWDAHSDKETHYRIKVEQIRRAVDSIE